MELTAGKVAVVTGGGSGIGLALATAFARRGLSLVIADVQDDALAAAAASLEALGVAVLPVRCDVSKVEQVEALAAATMERFGAVHVVCNNAGVAAQGEAWLGPLSSWEWTMGVNFWGVVYGTRAFLPYLVASGGGHIVNTASIAGLFPGFGAPYSASKHAVVAITEDLFHTVNSGGLPIGVSCLCPGWVKTGILDADRNWPAEFGARPETDPIGAIGRNHVRRAIDEATPPAVIADLVLEGVEANRFWVLPHDDFLDIAVRRWHSIAERLNPEPPEETPGMPPRTQILAEVAALMEQLQQQQQQQ